MASNKKFAYYLRGNQLAIIESGAGTGVCSLTDYKNKTDCENAGGTWTSNASGIDDGIYRSPRSSVLDGLEIEYAYSPKYIVPNPITINENQFYINGWTVVDGYLTLLRSAISLFDDGWSSDASSLDVNDAILIRNSSRWNGLHKIQELQDYTGTHGGLKTYTKVSGLNVNYYTDSSVNWVTDETITALNDKAANIFSSDSIIWISGSSESGDNGGLYTGITITESSSTWNFSSATRYEMESATKTGETAQTSLTFETDSTNVIYLREAFRDSGAYLIGDVDTLNDEADEVPVNDYLSNAIVYYLKARLAEDMLQIDVKEYFMKEFYRILDKYDSSRIHTIRMIQAPANGVR
jgi:hypothetical protein